MAWNKSETALKMIGLWGGCMFCSVLERWSRCKGSSMISDARKKDKGRKLQFRWMKDWAFLWKRRRNRQKCQFRQASKPKKKENNFKRQERPYQSQKGKFNQKASMMLRWPPIAVETNFYSKMSPDRPELEIFSINTSKNLKPINQILPKKIQNKLRRSSQ